MCGTLSGWHMILDVDNTDCHKADFQISPDTATSRSWDISIKQFACGDEMGGPTGCLQYFTGTAGSIANYGFPSSATVLASSNLENLKTILIVKRSLRARF